MKKHTNCDKMIVAILQGSDYHAAIEDLNENGFYATILNSSGGFLKKKSVTLMIGVNHEHLEEALGILKKYGERVEMQFQSAAPMTGNVMVSTPSIPVSVSCGGVVLFVMDVERNERY